MNNKTDVSSRFAMTVSELQGCLSLFPPNAPVVLSSSFFPDHIWYAPVRGVTIGVNEFDGLVFIDDYEEDE